MPAQVRYPGTSTFVTYQVNATALRGSDDIRILDGNTATIWGFAGHDTIQGSFGVDDVYGGAMTGWDIAWDSAGDDIYRLAGTAKAEIYDIAGTADRLVFTTAPFASLDALRIGDDIWVAQASVIAAAVAAGGAITETSIRSGAWVHDGALTGRIEIVQASDMSGSIDLLLA